MDEFSSVDAAGFDRAEGGKALDVASPTSLNYSLDPQHIDPESLKAIRELLREGSSDNTVASYAAAVRYWEQWYRLRYARSFELPLPPAVVAQFVVDHVQRTGEQGLMCEMPRAIDEALVHSKVKARVGPLRLNTILHRLSVLSKAHQLKQLDNPCQHPSVRELVSRARRAYARRGEGPARKDALTRELLEKVLATCDASLVGCRDRALLLFAWSTGGRRRSEVTCATLENTRRVGDAYLYTLGQSKTNQTGETRALDVKPVTGAAARALTAWLEAAGIREGALFRRVRRGGVIGEPLSAATVRDIVRSRCRSAGLDGDFSAHSLRSGFVTEAGRHNIPLGETMALTGHTSVASVMRYFRAGNAMQSRAAHLFDMTETAQWDDATEANTKRGNTTDGLLTSLSGVPAASGNSGTP